MFHLPSDAALDFYCPSFTRSKIVSKYSILYLAFHGHSGRIVLSDQEQLNLEDLADLMGQRFRGWSILLSCCSVLCLGEKRIKNFIKQTEVGLVIGYRKAVDWGESISLDLIILDHLVNYSYLAPMRKRATEDVLRESGNWDVSLEHVTEFILNPPVGAPPPSFGSRFMSCR